MANGALVDMTGWRVGRLTVMERGEDRLLKNGKRRPQWWCICDCGKRILRVGQAIRRTNPDNVSCGCLRQDLMASVGRGNHKGSDITYNTAHKRVRWARGRAREHPCIDCGGGAKEWSYTYADPDERVELVKRRNKMVPMRYSANPEYYEPRCHECHAAFDRGR